MAKRVFLIVLDSFGIGAEPDAEQFGDAGTNTLAAVATHPAFRGENMARLGLFNIDGVSCGTPCEHPVGSFARLREASAGKDTTIKVGFESVHNEGSLFWAFLPCEVDTLSMVEEKKEENISGGEFGANDEVMEKSAGRKTILIAEDIQSNYQLVSTILKDHYDLLHAENGQKAVEIARSQHVDLLMMDMKMPVLDGLKATAEIRKFNVSLPIVALTAHAFDSDRIAAIKVGCNEYLVKPIEKMKLMVALKKYL